MAQRTTPTAPDQASSKGFIMIVAAVLVLGLAAVAVLVSTRGEGQVTAEAGEQTAPVELEGDKLLAMPPNIGLTGPDTDPAYGAVAPKLTGTTFSYDGQREVTIEADGNPKVVYFIAHWCSHCQAEVPLIQSLIDQGQVPEGLDIYAVSTSVDAGRGNHPVSKWLTDVGFTPPVIRDDAESSALFGYGSGGFPYAVYLDGDNKVLARSSGELGVDAILQMWQITAAAPAGTE
jgi:cytochrome c biogenesis protein CcmG, thiol:disulfide interchange protein DsbE